MRSAAFCWSGRLRRQAIMVASRSRLKDQPLFPLDCFLKLYSVESHGFLDATISAYRQKHRQKTRLLKTNDKWSLRRGVNLSGPIVNSHSIPGSRESSQALRAQPTEDQIEGPHPSISAGLIPSSGIRIKHVPTSLSKLSSAPSVVMAPIRNQRSTSGSSLKARRGQCSNKIDECQSPLRKIDNGFASSACKELPEQKRERARVISTEALLAAGSRQSPRKGCYPAPYRQA